MKGRRFGGAAAIFVAAALLATAVPAAAQDEKPFAGINVNLLTFNGPQVAEPLIRRAPDFEAETGAEIYQQRLGTGTTGFTASLVAADGKVYFSSEEGDVFVVKAGRTFELLSKNPVGEILMATPAISEGTLYFRTDKSIIAVK